MRDFGDGFVAVLLPVYLTALGFSPFEVGAIATAALLGSALLTLGIGMIGSRHDRRRLLLAGAGLMIATGVAIAVVHEFALLLVLAFAGTINPSAGSVSIVPLEHAVLSGEVADRSRTGMFARYRLIGALSAACGALAAAIPAYLADAGMDQLTAIKARFVFYALLGVTGCLLYARLPRRQLPSSPVHLGALGSSRHIVYRLAALFSLDAFAGGFVVQSLLALWLFERFDMSLSAASLFFFWSGLLSASSFPVAAWLSRHVGAETSAIGAAAAPVRERRMTAGRKRDAVLRLLRGEPLEIVAWELAVTAAEQERPDVKARRLAWFEAQPELDPARLVFIDETGASSKMARLRGRAPRACGAGRRSRMATGRPPRSSPRCASRA